MNECNCGNISFCVTTLFSGHKWVQ